MLEPRPFPTKLRMVGLGKSVSGNITADAFVVTSFDDLDANKDKVAGKIVIYAVPWVDYGTTCAYRSSGAMRAAQYGAVGVIIRSVTPVSIESPHTGGVSYSD